MERETKYTKNELKEAFEAGSAMICAYEGDGKVDYESFEDWFKKNKEIFFTPYKYRVTLNNTAERNGDKYIIYYKGRKMEIGCSEFEFCSENILGNIEFLNIIAGTKGVIRIYGKFKIDDYE